MANYYTYGMVPDVDETVYGTSVNYAGLGFPEFADRGLPEEEPVGPSPLSLAEEPVPANRPLPEEPYYSEPPVAPTGSTPNIFVEGADVPQSSGFNMGALDQLFANLRKTEELQKLALEPGLLQQGFTGTSGITAPPSGAGIYATPTRAEEPAIDFNVTPEMAAALQQVARPADITAAEREAVTSNPRVQALQQISDQLKANEFGKAFDTALAAERDLGGDFVGNIIDSNKMRALRGPMTAEEITKFYNEMPQKVFEERYLGPGNEFKKEQAIERNIAALGGEAGYVDPMLGVKKEETLLSKLPIQEMAALAALAMGATAIPGLFGAGAGSGAGAGAAGAGGAGAAGAAGGAGALTGVVPTGLVAGTTAANLALPVFTVTAGGGLTAAQLAAAAAALGGAGALTGGSAAAPTSPTTPSQPPLEEVVVQATRPPVIPPAAVAAPVVGALATQPAAVEPPLEEVVVEAKKPIEPEISVPPPLSPPTTPFEPTAPEAPLEEVVIEAKKPVEPEISVPPPISPPTTPFEPTVPEAPLEEVVIEAKRPVEPPIIVPPAPVTPPSPIDTAFPEAPLEEVVVEAKRPIDQPVIVPPVPTTPPSPIDTAFPEGPIEEVVIESKKTPEPSLVVPPVVIPPAAPVKPPFPEGPVEEVVVETKRPPPADELIIPPVVIPPTTPVDLPKEPTKINEPENPLKSLLDKYGSLENLLKLLGALGSAASGTKGTTAPTAPTGGMGGALPKYTYTRQQLSPDIDYYTYGTRPEAKFFDYGVQLEKPTQPELPPAKPPGDEPVMAKGGLMGYAKGGSKKSRYVDGPGSGRDDKIPALLSDGEYVMDAETLALLGDGSTKEGARRMDKFRAKIRQHKGRALSRGQISPDAKSPEKYMVGGLA